MRRQYDRAAGSYDRRWRGYVQRTLRYVRDHLGLRGDEAVLDLACGTGELVRLLRARHPELRIAGVDLSPRMLAVARAKFEDAADVTLLQGRAEALPFPDDAFDVVVSANAFHYFTDPAGALREARRVLRPGGRAVVMDWCRDYRLCRAMDWMLHVVDPAHHACYTLDALRAFFRQGGLTVTGAHRVRLRIVWGMMFVEGRRPSCVLTAGDRS